MPKFMVKATYTADGMKGLLKDKASGRQKAVAAAIESLGGKLDAIYYALGDHDCYVIADAPSSVQAAALGAVVSASGMARTSTVTLLTVAEMDEALAKSVNYRPPGA